MWPAVESAEPSWQIRRTSISREELFKVMENYVPSVIGIEACTLCGGVRDLCAERHTEEARLRNG